VQINEHPSMIVPKIFDVENGMIAYRDDGRALFSEMQVEKLKEFDPRFVLGSFEFSDDESVHADHWERHPAGDEVLFVLEGRLLATIEAEGGAQEAVVEAGQGLIVPRARWHRLQVLAPGRLLAFTPVCGVELRPHAGDGERPSPNAQEHER
jgi:mannose-6-phosphate isomerase-like protein (cupin superfamily)